MFGILQSFLLQNNTFNHQMSNNTHHNNNNNNNSNNFNKHNMPDFNGKYKYTQNNMQNHNIYPEMYSNDNTKK